MAVHNVNDKIELTENDK